MANRLKMAIIDTILTLHARKLSGREIAEMLGIDRSTVARYLREATQTSKPAMAPSGSPTVEHASKPAMAPSGSPTVEHASKPAMAPSGSPTVEHASKPAMAPPGSPTVEHASKPAMAPSGSPTAEDGSAPGLAASGSEPVTLASACSPRAGRPSACEPWRDVIVGKLAVGLSAQRIHQDLTSENGFPGSYYSVRRFVAQLETHAELPMRRMECAPGEEVQVDFGTGAPLLLPEGKRRRTHVFRIVLSHSRKAYSEVVLRQTTEDFLRCLENAFHHLGGVPEQIILDNLRAAVTKADWFEPELNPKVQAFARHYGTVFLPTRPYTPRHKGKVERGIDYVQENALKGRTFPGLEEENQFLQTWEATVADTRIHGTTRRQVAKVFVEVERAALRPLPIDRFPFFHEGRRTVHRDGHVEIARAYYSVPPEYLGRRVWVRWDGRLVRVFNERLEQIALHAQHEPGRFSTQNQHIASAKISSVERGAVYLFTQVNRLGPHSTRWAEAVLQTRGVEGLRVLQGLLSLARRHARDQIERACEIAYSYGADRLRTVRALIEREAPKQQLAFTETDPLIRPLADYGQFVHDAFQKKEASS